MAEKWGLAGQDRGIPAASGLRLLSRKPRCSPSIFVAAAPRHDSRFLFEKVEYPIIPRGSAAGNLVGKSENLGFRI